jgi:erythromycin esterase-like protein
MEGTSSDFDEILELGRNASFVLIGEASHGTEEFYQTRAELSRRFIDQLGFNAVIIEGDWPKAARVNKYVLGKANDGSADDALSDFDGFPEWMWRNTAVRDFVDWLREHNESQLSRTIPTRFYGMDLYSPIESASAVIEFLSRVDTAEAGRAAARYAPILNLSDAQEYGAAVAYGRMNSLAAAVREQFEAVQRIAAQVRNDSDAVTAAAAFDAEQNARLVMNAEEYYRGMYSWSTNTWNIRDGHMADSLDAVADFLRARDGYARILVWAHNSHLGDARATDAAVRGEWNVGQLMRERHPGDTFVVGFSTSSGTVYAADDWGAPGTVKQVRDPLPQSWERAFHESDVPAFVLPLGNKSVRQAFDTSLMNRAIGVIYRPATERQSHYFGARIADQFDAVIHFDRTRAVEPLVAETFLKAA